MYNSEPPPSKAKVERFQFTNNAKASNIVAQFEGVEPEWYMTFDSIFQAEQYLIKRSK
jgi:hypothetical protein